MLEGRYLRASDRRPLYGGLGAVGIRAGRWKYIRYATGERELYDLQRDPLELHSIDSPSPELLGVLDRTWRRTVHCVADACRTPLPEQLRLGADEVRQVTQGQEAARDAYYGEAG
jgi:arylsulfatase A-like enzyme